ncbi:hypothetical protein [Candidatus Albibeggiatoa sp. nov. NOAA]|uniref:hypothetical protein n=1 Tax=Candidatus Albibeggiatoa sp. nov. NOAA TaxID=3162724 RepID=UPI0032FF145D|nr:hypothetical protein [Thiotrichaceae bacterium]
MHYILLGLLLLFIRQPLAADTPPPSPNGNGSTTTLPTGNKPPPPTGNQGTTLPLEGTEPPHPTNITSPSTSDQNNTTPPTDNQDKTKLLQTSIEVDGAQISLSTSETDQCSLVMAFEEQDFAGIADGVEETDICGTEQNYTSQIEFNPKTASKEGFFCFKTPDNNYGWGKHNCREINQFAYEDTGEQVEIPVHEPPILIIPKGRTEEETLNRTVAYGDKLVISLRSESPQGYRLEYKTKHAPIDTKVDNYNHILTWEAKLLGQFRFDIIIREADAKYPQELVLKASVNVKEHKLTDYGVEPKDISEVTAEQIAELPPEAFQAFREPNIKELHPEVFKNISVEQMYYMTYSAISAISVPQFSNMSPEILGSVRVSAFGGFSSDVLFEFTSAHIKALNPSIVFAKIPGEDTSKVVTNFDLKKVSIKDINDLLPPDWFFDGVTGALIVPGGTPLTVRALDKNPALPPSVKTPKLPKLNSNLALGGEASGDSPTILDSMNETLKQNNLGQFTFDQNVDGIVNATDDVGGQFAFIPNNSSFLQQDEEVETKIEVDRRELRIVTAGQQEFSLIPAPKDMAALREILPDGDIAMGDKGDVIFSYANVQDNRNMREESDIVVVCEFDAFVETLFSGCDNHDAFDLFACDDDRFFDELGVHITRRQGRLTRAGEYQPPTGKMAYGDKTTQTIYPTIIEPAIFLTMLHQINGLDDAEVYINGAYLISFNQTPYILQPDFTATATPLPKPGTLVPPAIHFRESGYLEYRVVSNDIEYVQKVFINPFIE